MSSEEVPESLRCRSASRLVTITNSVRRRKSCCHLSETGAVAGSLRFEAFEYREPSVKFHFRDRSAHDAIKDSERNQASRIYALSPLQALNSRLDPDDYLTKVRYCFFNAPTLIRGSGQIGPPVEDQIVAVLDLGEEQPVLTAGFFAFPSAEKRREGRQPLLTACEQVLRC